MIADVAQQIEHIYHEAQRNYGYRRITLALKKVISINPSI
ncbi:TPA: transposase [Pasteurella multocida]|nr:transposase [Pasteurella multocida]